MTRCFLGGDLGATKSHLLVADETGLAVGFAVGGSANHERVGYDAVADVVGSMLAEIKDATGIGVGDLAGAAIGASGFDWESERAAQLAALGAAGLRGLPVEVVNDAIVGLLAGAEAGWGVGLVAGTGCNCWGITSDGRYGRVLGMGGRVGEFAGGASLVERAIWSVARAATSRGPATALTDHLVTLTGARDAWDLLEGYCEHRLDVPPTAAPLVFDLAAAGDEAALACITWAAEELADLAIGVVRQLGFEKLTFDLVLIGSLYKGGPLLVDPLLAAVRQVAPGAQARPLTAPPVVGGVRLAMARAGLDRPASRDRLIASSIPLFSARAEATADADRFGMAVSRRKEQFA